MGYFASSWPVLQTVSKEKMILGVAVSEIEKLARVGESYEQAAARINKTSQVAR